MPVFDGKNAASRISNIPEQTGADRFSDVREKSPTMKEISPECCSGRDVGILYKNAFALMISVVNSLKLRLINFLARGKPPADQRYADWITQISRWLSARQKIN